MSSNPENGDNRIAIYVKLISDNCIFPKGYNQDINVVLPIAGFTDMLPYLDILFIDIGDVIPPVGEWSIFNFIEKVSDKSGKTALVK